MLYTLARTILKIAKWLWPVVLIPLITTLITVFIPLFVQAKPSDALYMFLAPGPLRMNIILISCIVLSVLLLVPLIAWLILLTEGRTIGNKVLRQYLQAVVEAHQRLNPRGFAQQSALISANVPLAEIFIHLKAVSDRPLHDLPEEQQRLLEELSLRDDLNAEQLRVQIQRLTAVWYSQLGQRLTGMHRKQGVAIEEVVRKLTFEHPAVVILGAPGSGKSTTMRWLALQMARALLAPSPSLMKELLSMQIPILLPIREYAKHLSKSKTENLSFEEFIIQLLKEEHTDLPEKFFDELREGRCILLFDGLDEVKSQAYRRQVAESIQAFILKYSLTQGNRDQKSGTFNRFVLTSRIVGYEASTFVSYAHYTLLDLEDDQIERFLAHWCPAIQKFQILFSQGMNPLTAQQEAQVKRSADEQRGRLWSAIQSSPSIKRLAVNPLTLTILALIQQSGKTLPHRRIELYDVVTRTLLDNWNEETGRIVFKPHEFPLVLQILSDLAYYLHSHDLLLAAEDEVRTIVLQAMTEFHQSPPDHVGTIEIQQFIDILRSSSGLFIESGQELFSFMHRTFQEYFVARYLLRKSPEELVQFLLEHYRQASWREPLLLVIAHISDQSNPRERRRASELIQAIALDTRNVSDDLLHNNTLFAVTSMIDCNAWSIDKVLQHRIINSLFEIYGDTLGKGRYSQLQREIENVILLWLLSQPEKSRPMGSWPPLLEAWRTFLCDPSYPKRQEGAVHLLETIAPDLLACPENVLIALIPPLVKLVGLEDLPCPIEIRAELANCTARAASLRIQEYAFVALRLLEKLGPAGWLHTQWLEWSENTPKLLENITRHSLEERYLLTPAALPAKSTSVNWDTQLKIANEWQNYGRRNPRDLQVKLLNASDSSRYPHSYFFKILEDEALINEKQNWRMTWDARLRKEMAQANVATFQPCLNLRLLLWAGNEPERKKIAAELIESLSSSSPQQVQAIITITDMCLRKSLELQNLMNLLDIPNVRGLMTIRDARVLRNLRDLQGPGGLQGLRGVRDLRGLRELLELRYLFIMLNVLDLQYLCNVQDVNDALLLLDLSDFFDGVHIVAVLSDLVNRRTELPTKLVFLSLYCFMMNYPTTSSLEEDVMSGIEKFEREVSPIDAEDILLIAAIKRLIKKQILLPPSPHELPSPLITAEARAISLYSFNHQKSLTDIQVKELLAGCKDTRQLSKDIWQQVGNAYTVQQIAWRLLTQRFDLETSAFTVVLESLHEQDSISCAAAALLLQHCRKLPVLVRKNAEQRILKMLVGELVWNYPPLEVTDYSKFWRLDDVLFETLKKLAN